MTGKLYIVATPIGNLQDITLRAIETLKQVDLIAAEDTRHSRKLLNHYGIETSCTSFHDQNEQQKFQYILEKIKSGLSVALVSDAGTPLISDPGYRLVSMSRAEGVSVIPLPGCCAAIAALSSSGLPSDRFYFEGFLPAKQQGRLNRFNALKALTHTLIFYESPHRILDFMKDLNTVFGDERQVVIARELTKTFETIHQSTAKDTLSWLAGNKEQRLGEFVVLVQGNQLHEEESFEQAKAVYHVLCEELALKQSVKLAAKIAKVKKNKLYEWAIGLS